jgi:hypothetical protein
MEPAVHHSPLSGQHITAQREADAYLARLTLPAGNLVLGFLIFLVARDHQPLARQPLTHSLHRCRGPAMHAQPRLAVIPQQHIRTGKPADGPWPIQPGPEREDLQRQALERGTHHRIRGVVQLPIVDVARPA